MLAKSWDRVGRRVRSADADVGERELGAVGRDEARADERGERQLEPVGIAEQTPLDADLRDADVSRAERVVVRVDGVRDSLRVGRLGRRLAEPVHAEDPEDLVVAIAEEPLEAHPRLGQGLVVDPLRAVGVVVVGAVGVHPPGPDDADPARPCGRAEGRSEEEGREESVHRLHGRPGSVGPV